MKLDDVDWHNSDQPNAIEAGMHIALVFCWLVTKGYMHIEADNWHNWPKLFAKRKISPGEFFIQYSDGQLVSDDVANAKVRAFLEFWYKHEYLPKVGLDTIVELLRNPKFEFPYDIEDSWKNVDRANDAFDGRLNDWHAADWE